MEGFIESCSRKATIESIASSHGQSPVLLNYDKQGSVTAADMHFLKTTLVSLTQQVISLAPAVAEHKAAYDYYQAETQTEPECLLTQSAQSVEVADFFSDDETPGIVPTPPNVFSFNGSPLDSLNKLSNSNQTPWNLTYRFCSELAGIVTKLLSQEMDRATKAESLSKFARPENCERLDVSRTNPEFF